MRSSPRFILVAALALSSCGALPKPLPSTAKVERPKPSPDDPAVLFAGCSGVTLSERSVLYRCGAILASVSDSEDLSPDALLRSHVAGFKASAKGRVEEELDPLTVAGRPVQGVRVSVFPQSGGEKLLYRGHFAGVTAGKRVRVVSCGVKEGAAPLLERCGRILSFLAARGPPPAVAVKARATTPLLTPATILGRPLTVPEECSTVFASEEGARLQCVGAELSWSRLATPPRDEQLLDDLVKGVRSGVKGEVTEERVACLLEGTATTCRRLTITVPAEAAVTGYLGVAMVKGVTVLAQCSFTESGAGLHPVCNDVFALP